MRAQGHNFSAERERGQTGGWVARVMHATGGNLPAESWVMGNTCKMQPLGHQHQHVFFQSSGIHQQEISCYTHTHTTRKITFICSTPSANLSQFARGECTHRREKPRFRIRLQHVLSERSCRGTLSMRVTAEVNLVGEGARFRGVWGSSNFHLVGQNYQLWSVAPRVGSDTALAKRL